MILAKQLPMGALVWGHEGWGIQEVLAARTVEMLDAVRRQVAASAGIKKVRRQKPYKIPLPEALQPKTKSQRIRSASGFADYVRGLGGSE